MKVVAISTPTMRVAMQEIRGSSFLIEVTQEDLKPFQNYPQLPIDAFIMKFNQFLQIVDNLDEFNAYLQRLDQSTEKILQLIKDGKINDSKIKGGTL